MQRNKENELLLNILILKKDISKDTEFNLKNKIRTIKTENKYDVNVLLQNYDFSLIIAENDYLDYLTTLEINIPVIGIGFNNDYLINEALIKGCIDYITIPYNVLLIQRRLMTIIKSVESDNNNNEYDSITGLYTKEAFEKRCHDFLQKHQHEQFDIMCLDFKNFKLFNNRHGSKMGNQLLKFTAEKIKLSMENSEFISRISGDVFVMLTKRPFRYRDEYFAQGVNAINEFPCEEELFINFGIYQIENNLDEVRSMYDKAIIACNSIKENYNVHYAVYTDSMLKDIENKDFFTLASKEAFVKQQFKVYYQPKYSMNNELIAGAEALVRWEHPSRGIISPDEFIPHFEHTGLISALDYYIWERVCQDLKMWADEDIKVVPISVNVSRVDLQNDNIFDFLTNLTERYEINRNLMHLEITESAYTKDSSELIETIKKLQNAGFTIEMDDFGSGYSSLNSIAELPIDIIKLDMKFIDSLNSEAGRNIIDFIRNLATTLDLTITAEGVESASQLKKIKRIKCDYVQGHYYARPMKEEDFRKQLVLNSSLGNTFRQPTVIIDKHIKVVENLNSEKSVLFIDNHQIPSTKLIDILKNHYSIFVSNNSESAVSFLNEENKNISAIIIKFHENEDINWKTIDELKDNSKFDNIPVIISTKVDKYIIQRAFQNGISDVFTEPLIPVSVIKRLDNVIRSSSDQNSSENIKLLQQSYQDDLTKLSNRRGFERKFSNLIMDEKRIDCAFFMIEIDNFNEIFTNEGIAEGYKKIVEFSDMLKANFRSADILARSSTAQFIAVMTDSDNETIIRKKADSLIQKTHLLDISCSAGVVLFNSESVNRNQLLALANKALDIAKSKGMNTHEIIKIK